MSFFSDCCQYLRDRHSFLRRLSFATFIFAISVVVLVCFACSARPSVVDSYRFLVGQPIRDVTVGEYLSSTEIGEERVYTWPGDVKKVKEVAGKELKQLGFTLLTSSSHSMTWKQKSVSSKMPNVDFVPISEPYRTTGGVTVWDSGVIVVRCGSTLPDSLWTRWRLFCQPARSVLSPPK